MIAVYALDHELERVAEAAREPLARQVRLTWWREAVGEALNRRPPRRHPVVEALAAAASHTAFDPAPLEAAIDARFDAVDISPFDDETALDVYLRATEGGVMRAALDILAPDRDDDAVVAPAARAWGLARLARQHARDLQRLMTAQSLRGAVDAAVIEARAAARRLPTRGFPAVAHVTLAPAYAAGRTPSELGKRLRLLGAVAAGRL